MALLFPALQQLLPPAYLMSAPTLSETEAGWLVSHTVPGYSPKARARSSPLPTPAPRCAQLP